MDKVKEAYQITLSSPLGVHRDMSLCIFPDRNLDETKTAQRPSFLVNLWWPTSSSTTGSKTKELPRQTLGPCAPGNIPEGHLDGFESTG